MAKYLSNRQKNLKVGIVSYTESNTVLEVTGKVGIKTTNAQSALDVRGTISIGRTDAVGINSIRSVVDINSWEYGGVFKATGTDDGTPQDIFFKDDGTKMFILGDSGNEVNEYALSTNWDVSTAAFTTVFSTALQETNPYGLYFKPDGTRMYICGGAGVAPTGDRVYSYTLNNPWSLVGVTTDTVAGAGTTVKNFNVGAQDTIPQAVYFKDDGLKMYVVGSANDAVYEYSLSTAWELDSTITLLNTVLVGAGNTLNLPLTLTNPSGIDFNASGTKMYITDNTRDVVARFDLATPWDTTTISFYDNVYVGFQELAPCGIFYQEDQSKAYIVGTSNDTVYQFNTDVPSLELSSSGITTRSSIILNNEARLNNRLYVTGDSHVSGNTTLKGTLTVDSTATLSSTLNHVGTTGNINNTTSANTLNLAGGAVGSGVAKVVNVGTGGASNSRTLITVGSATAGAISTVTIPSPTNLLIGSATSTGTASQPLQVSGGAYVSGSVGIGTTNPTSKLSVVGDGNFTGVVTATSFRGDGSQLTGISASGSVSISTNTTNSNLLIPYATSFGSTTGLGATSLLVYNPSSGNAGIGTTNPTSKLSVVGDANFTGVVTATTFVGALSGTATTASSVTANSVGLGTDTYGDYVKDITGTANQITVTSGTGEGSSPTLSIPSQFTAPQDVTVTRDLQVNRDLNVNGNITIGGTSATLFTTEFKVYDPDIVLGFRTDGSGNDVSTDTTANHGGIAIASTEGTPLISLYDVGVGETNPATYKKFMWFKSGTFSGLGTDAWLSNYAIGIGSTQVPNGVRLAAGGMQVTDSTLSVPQLNISGVSTFTGAVSFGTSAYFGDNDKLIFGDGGDLEIYHDGSNSYINNTTGSLYITDNGNNVYIQGSSGESSGIFRGNGAVELYYDNSKKFETTGYGATVFGTLQAPQINITGIATINQLDVNQLSPDGVNFGTALYVPVANGSGGWNWATVASAGAGNLNGIDIREEGTIVGTAGSTTSIDFRGNNIIATGTAGGAIATVRVSDTPTFDSLDVTGFSTFRSNVNLRDNNRLRIGDGNDLEIYHDGGHSYIIDSGTGNLYIAGDSSVFITNSSASETKAKFTTDGAVELYYDNSKKFETTSTGISVSNGASTSATIAGPAELIIDPAAVGDNTGLVRIKGDLYVDGTTTQINSTTLEIADFIVGIASTATTDLLADGAGIQIGPDNTFLYEYNGGTNPSLKSSENLNVASGKVYQIAETERLSADTLSLGTGTTIHSPSSNVLSLGVAGGEKLRVSNSNVIVYENLGVKVTPAANTQVAIAGTLGISEVGGAGTRTLFSSSGGGFVLNHNDNSNINIQSQGSNRLAYQFSNNAWSIPSGGTSLLVGTGATTGTSSQKLQVSGGAYVSGNLGVGNTNPLVKLHVSNGLSGYTGAYNARTAAIIEGDNVSGTTLSIMGKSTGYSGIFFGDESSEGPGQLQYIHGDTNAFRILTNSAEVVRIDNNGNVGIATTNPQYKLHVIGSFAATTKSFVIDHPTKEGMKLRYGSLEGPENGVYVRGRLKGNNTIELPEYWTELVDEDSITVNLTPIGRNAPLHSVVDIVDNIVVIESANDIVDCFYTVFAERKDVAKLEVEF